MDNINRREFLRTASAGAAMLGVAGLAQASSLNLSQVNSLGLSQNPSVVKNALPRWRGFNLLPFFRSFAYDGFYPWPFEDFERDCKWISDWGFDFVCIPVAYHYYVNFNSYSAAPITKEEAVSFNEEAIETIEKAVYLANKYKLHVSFSLYRVPGYAVNNESIVEPYNLWTDEEAQQALYTHWDMWAKRFKNVSPKWLSFNLIKEPNTTGDIYRKIAIGCKEAILKYNPDRLINADGNWGGNVIIPELEDLNISQSCRGYNPAKISHFRNAWGGLSYYEGTKAGLNDPDLPVWPGAKFRDEEYNRQTLEEYYKPWIDLMKRGVGVHCGECGCYNKTPHDVFLAWFTDVLDIFKSNGIGWALWNFRGSFGVVDSGRKDVNYKNFHGHQVDTKLLKLLQKY